jgi:carbamoyltransferase
MNYTLGIQLGHHSSCALVCDGQLVAAVQQERISRRKHDGSEALSNRLPVQHCLRTAGITLDDVDCIVSSFQTVSPGGFGLHKPLIEPGFNLFDPWDSRHFVMSHHLAHAYCAFGASGFDEAAVLVCDLGGSSTLTGHDFYTSFKDWYADLTRLDHSPEVFTECHQFMTPRTMEWC